MDIEAYGLPERFTSTVFFKCPYCYNNDVYEVDVPEFNYNVEQISDLHSQGDFTLACLACENEFSGFVNCFSSGCEFKLSDFPNLKMAGDSPIFRSSSFEEYEPPEFPKTLFDETVDRCLKVIYVELESENDPQFMNRIAFVTIITALETYLADTLLDHLKSDRINLLKLAANDPIFSRHKVSIRDIASEEDFLYKFIFKSLRTTSFHSIARVTDIYAHASSANLRKDLELWKRVVEYVSVRHDCVHRNGFDGAGRRRNDITRKYVVGVANDCRTLVSMIENDLGIFPF